MFYVYLIESCDGDHRYVGFTGDLGARMARHNSGGSAHTAKFRPWRLVTCLGFSRRDRAQAFERYLKSGSGHAFANKRLW
ncbi:MAG: GIY-YIG nuclease family protein [Maricaulis maris]